MSKKKRYKNIRNALQKTNKILGTSEVPNKKLKKKFSRAITTIERDRMYLYELDKKHAGIFERKDINRKAKGFYDDMTLIQGRQKLLNQWEDTGFLDKILEILKEVFPIVKTIAKMVAQLILNFLSLDCIKRHITAESLSKVQQVFNIAMAL